MAEYIYPYTDSEPLPGELRTNADSLVTSAYARYRRGPNPQTAYEALTTGATPDVVAAMGADDPELDQHIRSTRVGTTQPEGQMDPTRRRQGSMGGDVYTMGHNDWNEYRKLLWMSRQEGMPQNVRQWRDLGIIPVPNLDWYRSVHGAPAETVKKLQQFLRDHNFGYFTAQDPQHMRRVDASGHWDEGTDFAMRSYLMSHFLPDALWSKDDRVSSRASAFLSALGMDVKSVAKSLTSPEKQRDVFFQWMHTLPLNQGHPQDMLDYWADQYGQEHMPEDVRRGRGSWVGRVLDTVVGPINLGWNAVATGVTLPVQLGKAALTRDVSQLNPLAHLGERGAPAVLEAGLLHGDWRVDPLSVLLHGTAGVPYEAEGQRKARELVSNLSPYERASLAPLVQDVHDQSGFLDPLLSRWDQARNRALLGVKFFFQGLPSHGVQNPFDSSTWAGQQAERYKDSPAAGLFGDSVGNFPVLGWLLNQTVNILDDPLTYTGVGVAERGVRAAELSSALGRALTREELERGAVGRLLPGRDRLVTKQLAAQLINSEVPRGERKMAARLLATGPKRLTLGGSASRLTMLKPATVADAFSDGHGLHHLVSALVNPKDAARREVAGLLGTPGLRDAPDGELVAMDILGIPHGHGDAVAGEVRQILAEPDPDLRYSLLEEHFGERLHNLDFHENYTQARKLLTPEVASNLSEGKAAAMLTQRSAWGNVDKSAVDHVDDRIDFARRVREMSQVMGLDGQTYDRLIRQALSHDKGTRHQAATVLHDAMTAQARAKLGEDGYNHFVGWLRGVRGERGVEPSESRVMYQPGRDPQTGAIREMSTTTRRYQFADPATAQVADRLREHMRTLRETYDTLADKGGTDLLRLEGAQEITLADRQAARNRWEGTDEGRQARYDAEMGLGALREQLESLPGRTGVEGDLPAAATSGQFRTWYALPFTPYEWMAYSSPALRRSEEVQRRLRIDSAMGLWKTAVLFKPASGLRIMLGDETARALIADGLDGGPVQLAKTLASVLRRRRGGEDLPDDLKASTYNLLRGLHMEDILPFTPGSQGYERWLWHHLTQLHAMAPEVGVWSDAVRGDLTALQQRVGKMAHRGGGPDNNGVKALARWIRGDSPEAAEFRRRNDGLEGEKELDAWAYAQDARLRQMVKLNPATPDGRFLFNILHAAAHGLPQIDRDEFVNFLRRHSHDENVLPIVVGRRQYGTWLTRTVGKPDGEKSHGLSRLWGHGLTDALVNSQRQRIYAGKVNMYEQEVRRAHPLWDDAKVLDRSRMWARSWVQKNTYQMQRSLVGTALRNVLPFYGATANFNRFLFRQAMKHPWTVRPTLEMEDWAGQPGHQMPTGIGWLLSKLAFTNGEDITWNPLHSFFLTAEGLSGSIPGLGPLLNVPLKGLVSENPELGDAISRIPGFEFVNVDSPAFPQVEQLLSGVSMLATGKPLPEGIPMVSRPQGYYERREAAEAAGEHAQYREGRRATDATPESVAQAVGGQGIVAGLGGLLAPVQPRLATDVSRQAEMVAKARKEWDSARNDADKDRVIAAHPDMAPLLRHMDSRTTSQEKRDIVAEHPWVSAFSTPTTARTNERPADRVEGPGGVGAFKDDVAHGDIRYLTSREMINRMRDHDELDEAWSLYDEQRNMREAALRDFAQSQGLRPNDSEYKQFQKAWDRERYKPAVQAIADSHPVWRDQFYDRHRTPEARGRPLGSLMSWEVVPRTPDMETTTTVAWRQAKVWIDDAIMGLRWAKANGTAGDQRVILATLNDGLDHLATMDAGFARDIQRFDYGDVDDLVTSEAGI